jgi:hypothetical protein
MQRQSLVFMQKTQGIENNSDNFFTNSPYATNENGGGIEK